MGITMKLGQWTSSNAVIHFYAMDEEPSSTIIHDNNSIICEWCISQFGPEQDILNSRWISQDDVIFFKNLDDRMLFLLTWCY